jgi:hypothetical protein
VIADRPLVLNDFPMDRKPADDELNDPDIRALLTALKKVARPLSRKLTKPFRLVRIGKRGGVSTPVSPTDLEP